MKQESPNKSLLQTLCPSRSRMIQTTDPVSYRVEDQLQRTADGKIPSIVRASDGGSDGGTIKDKDLIEKHENTLLFIDIIDQ